MYHEVSTTKYGNFTVKVIKPHGFAKTWYVSIWHKYTWMMTEYDCPREQLYNKIRKECFKLLKEMRIKKFRMEYCR